MKHRLIPITLAVTLVIMLLSWFAFHKKELQIYPSPLGVKPYTQYAYSDTSDGGASIGALKEINGILQFTYRLSSGFSYPYAGMGFDLAKYDSLGNPTQFVDLEGYDSLRVVMRSTLSDELRIQIITHDPALSRPKAPLTLRYMIQNTPVDRRWKTRSLWIGDFTIPEWWFAANNLKADPANKFLSRVAHLDFQNGNRMLLGLPDTVEIAEIVAVGENRSLGIILAVLASLFLAGFAVLTWLERERLRVEKELQLAHRREEAIGQADKIPMSSHRTQDTKRVLEYIGKNYSNSELDLETVCRETGVNRNRLSQLLRDEVGVTFKGHLTDLRLSEATRALESTDLQVTEIAFTVGFGNVSHFNRIFKERFGITPVEYRKQKKLDRNQSQ